MSYQIPPGFYYQQLEEQMENKFSEALLEEIYNKVREENMNAIDACHLVAEMWNVKRNNRYEVFQAYKEYCIDNKVKS